MNKPHCLCSSHSFTHTHTKTHYLSIYTYLGITTKKCIVVVQVALVKISQEKKVRKYESFETGQVFTLLPLGRRPMEEPAYLTNVS